jgi:murein DD-endopeptidase MepM/ murein hydrolase activator NlpD
MSDEPHDMTAGAAIVTSPIACPSCKGPVDVKSRHVAIAGTAVRIYCSEVCLRERDAKPIHPIEPPRRRIGWWIAGGVVAAGTTSFVLLYGLGNGEGGEPRTPVVIEEFIAAAQPPPPVPTAPAAKAEPPRPSAEEVEDAALVEKLAHDTWIHPLAGPTRRMPVNHTAAFGAARAGERPPQCVSGHCGVDIGSMWGEPVHAVHDGVVYWVNRGPNEEHGGIFVEIAHHDGTLYSWYFHLAAVPRWVQPGVPVKRGQVIGLLGDTGVFHSAPHLHFQLTVKQTKTAPERYLDPEPLIAIWPLWIPSNDNWNVGKLMTDVAPGIPVREPEIPKSKAKPKAAPAPEAAAPEAIPASASGEDVGTESPGTAANN